MKTISTSFMGLLLAGFLPACGAAHTSFIAADAINALGIDLLHQTAKPDSNALLSPYSIQMAMAMTCAGADGQTRDEMARVLHYPQNQSLVDASFAALQAALDGLMQRQTADAESKRLAGITNEPFTLTTANRLFGQSGYDFRPAFQNLMQDTYLAPFEALDFIHDAPAATVHINDWVKARTNQRIQNLIPPDALDAATRLVLVNAIYFKAPWENRFDDEGLRPFYLSNGVAAQVPGMVHTYQPMGCVHRHGYTVVVVPYAGGELQLLILLPDAVDGLPALVADLKPETLADCARVPSRKVILFLPKFKLEPPLMSLRDAFHSLGMKSAFDWPSGSANFDRIAPRSPTNYLYISQIFHKTFLKLDEMGTEASAATAVTVMLGSAPQPQAEPPLEVHVDHPFLFAIQHRDTGACLFLGQVADPR